MFPSFSRDVGEEHAIKQAGGERAGGRWSVVNPSPYGQGRVVIIYKEDARGAGRGGSGAPDDGPAVRSGSPGPSRWL